MWERSFVAVSVLLGGSVEDALAALPVGSDARIAELASKLKDSRPSSVASMRDSRLSSNDWRRRCARCYVAKGALSNKGALPDD